MSVSAAKVSVTGAAAVQAVAPDVDANSVCIRNLGPNTAYLAGSSGTADTNAFPVVSGGQVGIELAGGETIYARCATSETADLRILKTQRLGEGDSTIVETNLQTASYTLVLGDANKVVELNNASALNLTVPPNSSVAFPVGTILEVYQYGAGQVTVVAGVGVTIRSPGGQLKLAAQYASASLRKRATDEWTLEGDITS